MAKLLVALLSYRIRARRARTCNVTQCRTPRSASATRKAKRLAVRGMVERLTPRVEQIFWNSGPWLSDSPRAVETIRRAASESQSAGVVRRTQLFALRILTSCTARPTPAAKNFVRGVRVTYPPCCLSPYVANPLNKLVKMRSMKSGVGNSVRCPISLRCCAR
jgi:hypothetical protein